MKAAVWAVMVVMVESEELVGWTAVVGSASSIQYSRHSWETCISPAKTW